MHIEEKRIPIREIFEGYKNDQENGVVGYAGRLDIRPAYQREFIYCQCLNNTFEHDGHLFDGLTEAEKTEILDKYTLMVYVCEGTDKEKPVEQGVAL